MDLRRIIGPILAGTLALSALPATAQTIRVYQCADGAQFALALYEGDSRAHLQLDGKALTLPSRLALSGKRYSSGGVTLQMTKDVTTLKRSRLPATTCKPLDKW